MGQVRSGQREREWKGAEWSVKRKTKKNGQGLERVFCDLPPTVTALYASAFVISDQPNTAQNDPRVGSPPTK